ncbi:hypothetical protein NDU88_006049 [Pleurodeles waltl]|uniref:Uncharacterized protein n=1 Tax=Pleurodeles waltl TaxID=8319 RepID=A0AAV7TEH5_PLEWA|nr:hypothetical protein NDU88_006049 [Pleurodeles waltl]
MAPTRPSSTEQCAPRPAPVQPHRGPIVPLIRGPTLIPALHRALSSRGPEGSQANLPPPPQFARATLPFPGRQKASSGLTAGRLSCRSEGSCSSLHSTGTSHLGDREGQANPPPPPQFAGATLPPPGHQTASSGPGRPKPHVASPVSRPPGSVPSWPTAAAGSCSAPCRAPTGSSFRPHLRSRSPWPEPPASAPADRERDLGLRGSRPTALPDRQTSVR